MRVDFATYLAVQRISGAVPIWRFEFPMFHYGLRLHLHWSTSQFRSSSLEGRHKRSCGRSRNKHNNVQQALGTRQRFACPWTSPMRRSLVAVCYSTQLQFRVDFGPKSE